jgi:hypothetical protein
MGLLEKALEFKKEMNSRGRETVMDRIKGPAETDFLPRDMDDIRAVDSSPEPSGEITVLRNGDIRIIDDEPAWMPLEETLPAERTPEDPYPEETSLSAYLEAPAVFPEAEVHDEMKDGKDEYPPEAAPSAIESDEVDASMLEETAIRDDGLSVHGTGGLIIEDEMLLPEDDYGADDQPAEAPGEEEKFHSGEADKTEIPVWKRRLLTVIRYTIYEEPERRMKSPREGRPGDEITAPSGGGEMAFEKNLLDDYPLLYEVENEIIKAAGRQELYDIILFTIMGQIGCTSSSMLVEEKPGSDRWIIAMSQGVKIDTEGLFFTGGQGIVSLLVDRARIIDIDDYRNDVAFRVDYLTYLSVDARYIAPVMHGDKLIGAVLMGEKVSVEDYTDKEKAFISLICDSAPLSLTVCGEGEAQPGDIRA